jgi:hypothetical protein
MGIEKPAIAVFDAKPYDRDYIARASGADKLHWRFQQFRLDNKTVLAADGAQAVCTFVNDVVNREILERLAGSGIRLVALAALPFACCRFLVQAAPQRSLFCWLSRLPPSMAIPTLKMSVKEWFGFRTSRILRK